MAETVEKFVRDMVAAFGTIWNCGLTPTATISDANVCPTTLTRQMLANDWLKVASKWSPHPKPTTMANTAITTVPLTILKFVRVAVLVTPL